MINSELENLKSKLIHIIELQQQYFNDKFSNIESKINSFEEANLVNSN